MSSEDPSRTRRKGAPAEPERHGDSSPERDASRGREPAVDPLVDAAELPADELELRPTRRRGDDSAGT